MRYSLALLLLLGIAVAQQVELGAGGYVTRRPADIIDPPATIHRSGWAGPAPTNRWWSSLLWTAFSETLYAGPLSFQARPDGLALGYPRLMVDEEGFAMPFIDDITVGLEHFTAEAARVTRFDDWTVTARWEAAEDGRFLEATIGQGLPYACLSDTGG